MKNQIKIAIADDHQFLIDGIKTALADSPEIQIVGEANNGLEIIEIVKTKKPDLVLLDIRMPELDGIEAAKLLKRQFKDIKIIIMTQFDERSLIRRCQKMGVEGYLLKDCGKSELLKAINKVYKGGIHFSINKANTSKIPQLTKIESKDKILSSRELEVLILMANDKKCSEIAIELGLNESTIRTYRQRLLKKSGTNTSAGLISWAYNQKLIQHL